MEKIQAVPHPSAILVVNGQAETLNCVSEIGRFGICFAENGEVKNNHGRWLSCAYQGKKC